MAIPLLAALGWLVWTVVDSGQLGGGGGGEAAPTTGGTGPVTEQEAETFVRAYYDALESEGRDDAIERFMDGNVPVGDGFAVGLISLTIDEDTFTVTSSDDGTSTVEAEVDYEYPNSTIRQDEEMRVSRVDGELLITRRSAQRVDD